MSALSCIRCQGLLERARALGTFDYGGRASEVYLVLGGRKWIVRVFVCKACGFIQLYLEQQKPEPRPQHQTVTAQIFGGKHRTPPTRPPDWNKLREMLTGE